MAKKLRSFASLTQLTIFVRIAECGSLSAAARELNLTPSAVSKSLAHLEERLGVLLVKRTTRSLTLTESGRLILERANAILTDVETTLDTARQMQEKPEGLLRLTSSIAFGCKHLTALVGRYLETHTKIRADIALDDRNVNLAEEDYDVALRITSGTDWCYAARKLAPIRWVYCAAPDYIDQYGPICTPHDLRHHACLVYPAMTLTGAWTFRREDDYVHIAVNPKLRSNSSLALQEAALAGHGVACLPTYLVATDVIKGNLKLVVPEYESAISHNLYAMYYRSRYEKPMIRSFIDFLVREIGEIPPWDRVLKEYGTASLDVETKK